MGPRHVRPSRTPSSTSTTATWWSPTSEVIKVNLFVILVNKESIKTGPRHVRPFLSTLIDVDNRNLVVPHKRVCHQSQLHIVYMFYTYFFSRNPLRWVPDMSDPSRTPSSTLTTATWWSHTSEFVIEVKSKY